MTLTIILFLIGFFFLIKGADFLVMGASSIAKKFGLSSLMIGLTIVAFGTSLPELLVSVFASVQGSAELAITNIIGSNISNTLLILGASALVAPLVVRKNTINKEIPFSLLAVLVVFVLTNDVLLDGGSANLLSRIDGLILLMFFVIFIYYSFSLKKEVKVKTILEKLRIKRHKNKEGEIEKFSNFRSIIFIAIGLVGLYFGGTWIVDGAITIARTIGLSEAFIGLTIVSIGTSLPELVTSVTAAKRGQTDMAVGNVIGSNIFNLFWILGLSSTIHVIPYNVSLNFDVVLLIIATIILIPLVYAGKKNVLTKKEGFILLALYLSYIAFITVRG
jgi:cation:H+ antiporter